MDLLRPRETRWTTKGPLGKSWGDIKLFTLGHHVLDQFTSFQLGDGGFAIATTHATNRNCNKS